MRGALHDLARLLIALGTRALGWALRVRHRVRLMRFGRVQAALHRRYGLGPDVPIMLHGPELQAQLEARAGRHVAYAATSGSSGLPKRIPYTAARVRAVKQVYMDSFCRAYAALGVRRTSLYVFSSLKQDESLTALMMSESRSLPPFFSTLQAPYRVHAHPSMVRLAERYGTAATRLWVLAISNPGCLYATNPSTLSVFMDALEDDWDGVRALVLDWVKGAQFEPAVHRIARRLSSLGSDRRLSHIAGSKSPVRLSEILPDLELICCWDGGYVRPFLARVMQRMTPDVQHLPMYSMSTETVETIPHFGGGSVSFLPMGVGVRVEFLPLEAAADPDAILAAQDLEVGASYSLVVSDAHGLRRYHTEDVFRCVGRVGALPDLRFERRLGLSFSFTGEKLTGDHVTLAMAGVRSDFPESEKVGWMVCIPSQPEGESVPHYRLVLGLRGPLQLDDEALSAAFDRGLCTANSEYADKRESGRIGAPRVSRESFEALVSLVGGERHAESWETQFKFLPMVNRTWEELHR